jgi:membrane-associated phospholipid phosphatase
MLTKGLPNTVDKYDPQAMGTPDSWFLVSQYSQTAAWRTDWMSRATSSIELGSDAGNIIHISHQELVSSFWKSYSALAKSAYRPIPNIWELVAIQTSVSKLTPHQIQTIAAEVKSYAGLYDMIKTWPGDCYNFVEGYIVQFASAAAMHLKLSIDRPRPYQVAPELVDPRILQVLNDEFPLHSSFPSGHSTESHLIAHVLSDFCPAMKQQLFDKAALISENREAAGLHYPSDTLAGQVLAELLYKSFCTNPAYLSRVKDCSCLSGY